MSNKHLKLTPHTGTNTLGNWWWYEEPAGIGIYSDRVYHDQDTNLSSRVAFIPWRSLRAALKRKDA